MDRGDVIVAANNLLHTVHTLLGILLSPSKILSSLDENSNWHCVKRVRIRSYSGPHFSRIFPHSDWIRREMEYNSMRIPISLSYKLVSSKLVVFSEFYLLISNCNFATNLVIRIIKYLLQYIFVNMSIFWRSQYIKTFVFIFINRWLKITFW